ncbi:MAG: 4'-phosphopantetheinyl transferase superfamily protein [Lachnospiraceae bacterium]|nr:4'-phosphopantetheinyl transferase superfamily protein [Lachnospiraceae bacterium]
MIYVCEYENMADILISQERLSALLLSLGADKKIRDEMMSYVYKEDEPDDKDGICKRQAERQMQRIVARALLDYALKKEFGVSFAELGWAEQKGGKPYSSVHPEIKFNISHCACACACAVGMTDIGIDIEKKFAYRNSLAKRICADAEWAVLRDMDEEERTRQLQYLWSLKESFVKWNGRGIAYGMDRVSFAEALPAALAYTKDQKIRRTILVKDIPKLLLYDGGAYTLCACAEVFDFTVNLIDTGELCDGKTDKTEI